MGFLSPALWLGALALAIPIWLHLHHRRPERVIPFPALRFLADEPAPSPRPVKLRNPWLLLLRAGALLALVAAFARPWLDAGPSSRVVESRVHVLDNTLSQQAAGGFERDRGRISRALASAGEVTEHAVVELTATPRVVVRFGDDPAAAAQLVRALEPSYERGSYLAAARLASSLLDRSLGGRRVIEFHGDGQRNQWAEGEGALPFLSGVDIEIARPPEVSGRPNLAVLHPEARRSWTRDAPTVELDVQIRYSIGVPALVEVISGRQRVLSKRIALPIPPAEDGSGTLALDVSWPADPSTWLGGSVSVSGDPDALEGDDRAWFAVPPVTERRVTLLGRSHYLEAALAPEVMRGRWALERLDPTGVSASHSGDDVLVVEASYLPAPAVRDRVTGMLVSGRGVVVLVDRVSPLVAGALRDLGVELAGSTAAGPFEGDAGAFRYVAAHHPLFRPFRSGGLGEVSEARVFQHYPVLPEGLQTIVYASTGDPLVAEVPGQQGRLLVLTFALERDHTDWPLQTSFVPFLDQALGYVRKREETLGASTPGEWRALTLPPDRRPERLVLRGPEGFREEYEIADGDVVRFRSPARPGLYELRYDDDEQPAQLLAVNPAASESELDYDAEPRAVAHWTVADTAEAESAREGAPALVPADAREQLWWHRLLVAALALIALELVVLATHRERHAAA